jgi:hypothetical protein
MKILSRLSLKLFSTICFALEMVDGGYNGEFCRHHRLYEVREGHIHSLPASC